MWPSPSLSFTTWSSLFSVFQYPSAHPPLLPFTFHCPLDPRQGCTGPNGEGVPPDKRAEGGPGESAKRSRDVFPWTSTTPGPSRPLTPTSGGGLGGTTLSPLSPEEFK